ncbi:hypothetical protein CERSUDRAFT_100316 [Gelatoporia subvermispora B]|uniref:Uncharacterized protein n=1 Tax=Ceriporiopsis subvermispora (strain B) TaxID=914234 RepID=M2QHD7_CERS8|nr:hypothetical protein CERSUDRAFT_100316 [Gelatoporia subvermispora B]
MSTTLSRSRPQHLTLAGPTPRHQGKEAARPAQAPAEAPREYETNTTDEVIESRSLSRGASRINAGTTILIGRGKHECNLRPMCSERYRQRIEERHRVANAPTRRIMRTENALPGECLLTSSAAHTKPPISSCVPNSGSPVHMCLPSSFAYAFAPASGPVNRPKLKPQGQFERMARDQLLDELFDTLQECER